MDQVGDSDIGSVGRMQPWHQQTQNAVGEAATTDLQFMMLRQDTRERISEYLGMRPIAAKCRERLPDLVMRLEEVLFRRYPNKTDYQNMTKEPIEPHILFALPILSAQHHQVQQKQQSSRQVASSGGYGTTTLTHGITQGASENSRTSYVPYNMCPPFGAGLVPQNANMGTSLSEAHDKHVNTHHSSRVSNNNHVIKMVDTSETNRILEVPKEPKLSCPVCLHEMVDASSTVCGHVFCQECIRASIKAHKKCPTCERKLNMRNFHRVYLPTRD